MKLAEALLIRAEYQEKLYSLKRRVLNNIHVQENETPHEDPYAILDEIFALNKQLSIIIKKINKKNAEATLKNGSSISDALVDREMLLKQRSVLSETVEQATQIDYRLKHSEIKMYSTVDIAALQKKIDSLSREYRDLDMQIQELNWITDID